ncbi:hypothetical protein ACFOY4_04990 [Actinomadura syzygii]|uniref:Lipoprotein n=1 Tax=Actinomadura syzygii TaxID=1427538 RepID=A0A5D0TXI9_9ACTN|nr:hypothetical protein [Actinomadura syzygii]TYC10042.1 hypothetical protein FXF65_33660 [Actinomadura syzygii]
MRVRMWVQGLAICLLVGFASACGGTENDPESAASSAVPLPDVKSMTEFASSYLTAMKGKNQAAADDMVCDGKSTLYTVITGVADGNWQIGNVRVDRHNGSAEIQETIGDTALGLQAKFVDGKWCATS